MAIELYRIDSVSYTDSWNWQKERVICRAKDTCGDALVLLEHPAVYTQGRATLDEHLPTNSDQVIRVERGGSITYHGPGQLVGYVILDLKLRDRDVHVFLRDIENILIKTLKRFGLNGTRRDGLTGVWVGNEKIAALGIHVRHWITSHGFSLNIDPDLSAFKSIRPCGLDGSSVTSLHRLLGCEVTKAEVEVELISCFESVFGLCQYMGDELPFLP